MCVCVCVCVCTCTHMCLHTCSHRCWCSLGVSELVQVCAEEKWSYKTDRTEPNTKWVGRIDFRFALLSLNKIVQVLPALLLTGIYGHDTPNCVYDCGHLTALLYKILLFVLSGLTSMNQSYVITQRPHFCGQWHGIMWQYRISRPIRRTVIFSLEILEKNNDECI